MKAYYNRGTAYHALGKQNEAVRDLTRVIEFGYPLTVANAYSNRDAACFYLDEYEKALADTAKAIELTTKNCDTYCLRANIYTDLGEYDKALKECEKALDIDSNCANAYLCRGICFKRQEQYDDAIKEFSKCIEVNPTAELYFFRALIFDGLGETGRAEKDVKKVIEIGGENKLRSLLSEIQ
jgi:tetratricopeptide (TPR) repeat protein